MQISVPIDDFLRSYAGKKPVRCHMPGGKGENNPFDITEIEGADSLFESSGIIAQSEKNAAKLFGAGKTLYSCGGSTLSVQRRKIPKNTELSQGDTATKALFPPVCCWI